MNIPKDIHTHRLPSLPGTAIVNVAPDAFSPCKGEWYSIGIHPWHVTPTLASEGASCPPSLRHPQVLAVGEAGLDKLAAAPMTLQVELFRRQARWAEEARKPLLIHLVKATDELLKVKRELCPSVPWIIHGFRGKAALAEEYLRHGFHLSFGEKYQEAALCTMPACRLFIETDESEIAVRELYVRAARVRGISPEELEETVRRNVRTLFFRP
ncbi:MAG: TatD family hydrolase [Bacteroides sp.]|nr:TatD family hydrolase [Bacteroides sp.]